MFQIYNERWKFIAFEDARYKSQDILFVCAIQWYILFLLVTTIHNGIRKYSNLLHFINVQFRKKNQFSFTNRKSQPNQQQRNDSEVFVCLFFSLYIFFNEREFINQCCVCKVTITSCARYCNKSLIILKINHLRIIYVVLYTW